MNTPKVSGTISGSILLLGVVTVTFISQSARSQSSTRMDRFGVQQLNPTVPGGREWFAKWDTPRVVGKYTDDPADPVMRQEDGQLTIADGMASVTAGITRLMVSTPEGGTPWRNVEMTIYARPGKANGELSYRALDLSARSGAFHNDKVPCEGTSYHGTARFDGKFGFKKEIWHTGGYTKLRPEPAPKPWAAIPQGKWVGLKFVCRNRANDSQVDLSLYLDENETNEWKLISHYVDDGNWPGEQPGCDRPINAVLTSARPAVYFRTDDVEIDMKKFSVREIAPLP